ncbi:MAG: RDD family protein [bacterium]|nr:RDD family protein [bacterium]
MSQLDVIMTGEAVAIEARPASVMTRAVSTIIDFGFTIAVLLLSLVMVLDRFASLNDAQVRTITTSLVILVAVVIPTAVETLTRGRSLGKFITGTRVVRDDGGPVAFRHSLTRWGAAFVEMVITFGLVALVVASLNPRSKRLGDLLAGTYVARIGGTEESDLPILCPPELEAWAANADMRSLPDRVSLYARKYLARTGTLTPKVRSELGLELAAEAEKYVAPRPPHGTHPERFLAAVLATRRDREYAVALEQRASDSAELTALAALPHGVQDSGN